MVLSWAWRASRQINAGLGLRAQFVLAALRERSTSTQLARLDPSTPLGRLVAEWPDTVGNLVWPYQCAKWDAKQRFARLSGHLQIVEEISGLKLSPDDKVLIADLSQFSEGLVLMLERPKWLSREGHLTLSLFKDDFRAFSVSFSLYRNPELELFIGGIQGRQGEHVLDLYRALTKELHGVRPRDFMLETLRMFAQKIGVVRIFAVADDHKIANHAFFREAGIGAAYDPAWEERGGIRVSEAYWELPVSPTRRNLEEVPSKKRSMYRQRYEMFDGIAASIPDDLSAAERRHFEAR